MFRSDQLKEMVLLSLIYHWNEKARLYSIQHFVRRTCQAHPDQNRTGTVWPSEVGGTSFSAALIYFSVEGVIYAHRK